MNAADWIIVLVLALSIASAAAQGFFFELFSLGGAVLGLLLATWFYGSAAAWFLTYARSPQIADAAGFLTIFFGTLLAAGIAARLSRWAVREAGLGWADRLLGAVFGLLRGAALVTACVLALAAFVPQSSLLQRSALARYFLVAARSVSFAGPSDLRARVSQGALELRNARPLWTGSLPPARVEPAAPDREQP